jgi:hypothetical protein
MEEGPNKDEPPLEPRPQQLEEGYGQPVRPASETTTKKWAYADFFEQSPLQDRDEEEARKHAEDPLR